tara:strand:- start:978 stop:2081 length:1104 start_codon:yes stop_codon:yes gene_type:complete
MKISKFHIITIISILLLVELLSFYIVKIKKDNLKKNLIIEKKFIPEIINSYSDNIPHLRDETTFYKLYDHIPYDEINNFFTTINNFNQKNTSNILFQGDSWAEGLNKKATYFQLKEYSEINNLGIINGGITSFSPSAMTSQLNILEKEYDINPNIIIAIVDQSDIGDELFRYKSINKSLFSQTLHNQNKNFQNDAINKFETFNLSSLKLIQYFYNYYNLHKKIYNSEKVGVINMMYKKIKSKIYKIPRVLYPLHYGISYNEKEIIKKRVDNYVNFAFKNKNLREIYFVTHPHLKHLDENSYKINISSIVDEVISESKYSKSIIHINFEKINQSLDKIIYVKGDVFSHLTSDAYSNYFLPKILEKINF